MHEREIVCALAHPYYTVAAPLLPRHRRRLAELFAIWEMRNGARARELNRPAATYVATHDGDRHRRQRRPRGRRHRPHLHRDAARRHARRVPRAPARRADAARAASRAAPPSGRTPRSRSPPARSEPRADGPDAGGTDPRTVMRWRERLLREGDARHGPTAATSHRTTRASCCARGWPRSSCSTSAS